MNWRRTITATVVLGAFVAAGAAFSADTQKTAAATKAKPAGNAAAKKLERGRYLTMIAGCNDCHTPGFFYGSPDWERTLSGSEIGWQGPWGVSYARNLTPHPTAGIGAWSEQQIVTALRTGVRPDGSVLLPPMPWPNFATMTDDDAYAIAAYLKSIPANDHVVPKALKPGEPATGSIIVFPPPTAWDAPRTPPAGAAPSGGGH
jgi:mono/diheme cytochrome c family protein